jgi:glycosyltransferase involved in cell wall biosynthesis
MATYNGARYLQAQLESIAAQSELPAELVISDDSSKDGTLDIAERFGRDAPFMVRILAKHDRLGFADNFLHSAENCQFPLIMLCDQDDIWLPNKLAVSRNRLLRDDSLMLLHTLALVDQNLQPIGVFTQGIHKDEVYGPLAIEPYLCGHGNTMMFRRELVTLFPRTRRPMLNDSRVLPHDTWLYTLAAALGNISQLTDSLILYRQHGSNVSSLDKRRFLQRLRDLSTFAIGHHARKATFNDKMASVFEELAQLQPAWRQAALAAAVRYRKREAEVRDRVNVYKRPSYRERLAAFSSVRRRRREDDAVNRQELILADAKDLLLGVCGLGFRT